MQRNSWDDLTLRQKMQVVEYLAQFPALTLLPWLRTHVGYRMLGPERLGVGCLVAFIIGGLGQDRLGCEACQLFAFLTLVMGLAQRARRKREMKVGQLIHTYYLGDSRFEPKNTPEYLRRDRKFARSVDPMIATGFGLLIAAEAPGLGLWLVLSGMSLGIVENRAWQRDRENELDVIDAAIESEVQSERFQQFAPPPCELEVAHDDPGIPSGIGQDIAPRISAARAQDARGEKAPESKPAAALKPSFWRRFTLKRKKKPEVPGALTRSDRFWRFFWGPRLWNGWQRRKQRRLLGKAPKAPHLN